MSCFGNSKGRKGRRRPGSKPGNRRFARPPDRAPNRRHNSCSEDGPQAERTAPPTQSFDHPPGIRHRYIFRFHISLAPFGFSVEIHIHVDRTVTTADHAGAHPKPLSGQPQKSKLRMADVQIRQSGQAASAPWTESGILLQELCRLGFRYIGAFGWHYFRYGVAVMVE